MGIIKTLGSVMGKEVTVMIKLMLSLKYKNFRVVLFPQGDYFSVVLRQEGYNSPDQNQVFEREEEKKLFFF